jgi:RNA polymerase sigma-70 factor (ECF subfamily)
MKKRVRSGVSGRSAKFEKLANQHKDAVYRQMIKTCGNREDAEDVLIEALLNAYRHLEQLRESAAFRGWLAQIARRVCWQLKKRESLLPLLQLSQVQGEGRDIASGKATPEQLAALQEMKHALDSAVAALPDEYRNVFEMRDLRELDGTEVALRLGISLAAMKSRLYRARQLVRESLDRTLVKDRGQGITK